MAEGGRRDDEADVRQGKEIEVGQPVKGCCRAIGRPAGEGAEDVGAIAPVREIGVKLGIGFPMRGNHGAPEIVVAGGIQWDIAVGALKAISRHHVGMPKAGAMVGDGDDAEGRIVLGSFPEIAEVGIGVE